uniref:Uncharacterized protein n=1 Tax=Salix viminalis TaxID=40686 RepID=A0A6N2NH16_SALVM
MWAPSRVLEPPFRAGVGSSLHLPSLSFSAKHALAKEKGHGPSCALLKPKPCSTSILLFSRATAGMADRLHVTEKKTAGHGQKTWSPDEVVTPASVSFHDSRRCQWCTLAQTFDDDDDGAAAALKINLQVYGILGPLLGCCLKACVLIQCSRK